MELNRSLMLVLILLLSSVPALYAQHDILQHNTETGPQSKFRRMDTIPLNIHFDIAEGFYVYAKTDAFGAMPVDGMKIEFDPLPAGFELRGDWRWSTTTMYNGMEVYRSRQHTARRYLLVTKACKPGTYKLTGSISFQACNEEMCYPSQTISFEQEIAIRK